MIKYYLSLFLVLTLVLTRCGVSREIQEPEAPVSVPQAEASQEPETSQPSQQESIQSPQDTQEAMAEHSLEEAQSATELTDLLNLLRENVRVGTAGSSLAAAQAASGLLDWAMETPLSEAQLRSTAEEWYQTIPSEEQEEAQMQIAGVLSAVDQVTGPDGWDLLDSAGCTESSYPWNDTAKANVEAALSAIPTTE